MTYLILALATWRFSAVLSYEVGPWHIAEKLRLRLKWEIFECVWCLSIWIAAVLWIIYNFWPGVMIVLVPFALSAGAIIVEKING